MSPPTLLETKVAAAFDVERTGQPAEPAWAAVLAIDPDNATALFHLGRARVLARDTEAGTALLERAARFDTASAEIPLYLGLARTLMGDDAGALAAFDRALAIDPYFFLALMSKGQVLQRCGDRRAAVTAFRAALQAAPPMDGQPPAIARQVANAKAFLAMEAERFGAYLRAAIAPERDRYGRVDLTRFDACLAMYAGEQPLPTPNGPICPGSTTQSPSLLYVPGLAAMPVHPRARFPWIAALEGETSAIRAECAALLAESAEAFAPFIRRAPHEPVEQWRTLNRSPAWRTAFLWRDGAPVEETLARCPRTRRALEAVPMCDQRGLAPTAMISVLAAHTHIPPHTGSTNARLIVHLPLIVPPACWFRVGDVELTWREGQAFVFDDTIEHEAMNGSDATRVVLIFDVWHPDLSAAERALITAMMQAAGMYPE